MSESNPLYKFEDIIAFAPNNYDVFFRLITIIETDEAEHKIACYIGTGLSLYYRNWGDPFLDLIEKLVHSEDLDTEKAECFRKRIEDREFLEVADEVDQIIQKKEADRNIAHPFNRSFLKVLEDKRNKEIGPTEQNQINHMLIQQGALPKESVFLIPYIGENLCLITTNCDETIERAFQAAGKGVYVNIDKTTMLDTQKLNQNITQIFYIHGRYNANESLVMTKTAYQEIYGSIEKPKASGSVTFLKSTAKHRHILFLGAGMEGDVTLEIMQQAVRARENNTGQNVAFLCPFPDRKPTIKTSSTIEERKLMKQEWTHLMDTLSIESLFTPSFDCYPPLLCQVIREAKSQCWNQRKYNHQGDPKNKILKLCEIVSSSEPFQQYTVPQRIKEGKLTNTLALLRCPASRDEPRWTICS